jgi:hypothetical protein
MKKIICFLVLSVLILNSASLFSQNRKAVKQKYLAAEEFLIAGNYKEAIKLFKYVDSLQPGNANVNFKIGLCYLNGTTNKVKAIPYMEAALKNVSSRYKEGSIKEKKTPQSAYFYLGKAYHLNYEFDKAIAMYEKYKTFVVKRNQADIDDSNHEIETCNNGKELVKRPIDVIITNLGPNINGPYPDFSPVVSLDENTIVFTSRREGGASNAVDTDGQYFEDIYISYKDSVGNWQPAKLIGTNINTAAHDASINISADGSKLFIYKDDNGNGNIYLSELKGIEWGSPEYMGGDINTGSWETHACFTADHKIIYFVSDRPGGFGGRDIYKCVKLPNGNWGPAQNLGATVNTKYDEDGVFIHPDGKQIFFGSKGHQSMGGFDIFTSVISDENGFWSAPVNIGYPVNTPDDDAFLITSADGKRGYFSSGKEGGYGEKDIYLLTFPGNKEKDITVLIGKFKKNEGCDLTVNQVTVTNVKTGEIIEDYSANSATGKFGFSLLPGNTYQIVYSVSGKELLNEKVDVPKGQGYQVLLRDIPCGEAVVTVPKDTVKPVVAEVIPPASYELYFKYNVKEIDINSPAFVAFVDSVLAQLKVVENVEVAVESSASHVPTAMWKTNEILTKKRAEEALVKITEALVRKGISSSKFKFNTDSKVQGPAYKGDFKENMAEYEKYQYVKVKVTPVKKSK